MNESQTTKLESTKTKNVIKINNRAFKGVWIDRAIYCDPNLTPTEKFLLVEISSFSNNNNICYASNQHFANFLGVDKVTVSRMISKLKNKGYISIQMTYKPNSKEILHRLITPNFGFSMNLTPLTQKYTPLYTEVNTPLDLDVKDTNTVVTNTSFTNTFTISNEKNEKALERKRRDRELKQWFLENIWERYPKQHRVGENLCFSKFKSALRKGVTKEEILEGFETYITVIEIHKGCEKYIKRLDNWFASESWNNPNKYMKSESDKYYEKMSCSYGKRKQTRDPYGSMYESMYEQSFKSDDNYDTL